MGLFDGAKEVRINNKVVKSIIGENNMTLYINGEISQPKSITLTNLGNSSVVYGTTVQLQATYSELGATLTGKTVTLYDGDTVKTTGTTDSNGEVTFSLPTLGVGSHQFKVTCNNTESDVITVVVNKITPTLSLSGSNIGYRRTLSLSGVLSAGSGKSVKIYNGNTLIDTVTTTTDGAFSKSVTGLNAGSYTFKAVFDGDGVYNSVNSADLAITVSKASTLLTINVPLSLIYSDAFNITGVLTDVNSNNLSGASVKLKVGDTVVDTQTTNSNGQVTFSTTPVSMGTHTFQLVYDGDANYNGCTSSSVTRQINAETTVLNLTSPVNNATYHEGATIPISGTITTNDGEQLSSENPLTVSVYDENNNQLRQFSITNGAFSGNITAPSSAGNHSITVKFEGASTVPSVPNEEPQLMYAQSEATRSYTVTSDSLTVTSNKNILSQADNDVATITATYNANENSGKVVTFSGAEMVKTISSSTTWLPTGDEAIISNIQLIGSATVFGIGATNNSIYMQNTGQSANSSLFTLVWLKNGSFTEIGRADITHGLSYSGNTLTYYDANGTAQTYDITGLSKQVSLSVPEGNSGSFTVTSSTVSAVTDSNGVATVSYNSQGAGDVTITAECMSLQETYDIEDCIASKLPEQIFLPSSSTTTYSVGLDSIGDIHNTDFELNFKYKATNKFGGALNIGASSEWSVSPVKANYRLSIGSDTQSLVLKRYCAVRTTSTSGTYGNNISYDTYYDCKIVREGNNVSFYFDGSLITTQTLSFFEDYSDFSIYGVSWGENSSAIVKDIKLKPL